MKSGRMCKEGVHSACFLFSIHASCFSFSRWNPFLSAHAPGFSIRKVMAMAVRMLKPNHRAVYWYFQGVSGPPASMLGLG